MPGYRRNRQPDFPRRALSVRELQVMNCKCVKGMTNGETGNALGISEQTVKNHTTKILRKMGKESMTGACYTFGAETGNAHTSGSLRADQV